MLQIAKAAKSLEYLEITEIEIRKLLEDKIQSRRKRIRNLARTGPAEQTHKQ